MEWNIVPPNADSKSEKIDQVETDPLKFDERLSERETQMERFASHSTTGCRRKFINYIFFLRR